MGALLAVILPRLLGWGIPPWLAKWLAIGLAVAAVLLGARIWWGRRMAEERARGASGERERLGTAWRDHADRVIQDVQQARSGGAAAARERLRADGAGGDRT